MVILVFLVGNETVRMVSMNDGTIPANRLPKEILETIISEASLSSGFLVV